MRNTAPVVNSRAGVSDDSRPECGYQVYNQKIRGGELTDLDEFPWMALLIYSSS